MRIDFTVGEIERHVLELSFDSGSGGLRIVMDGAQLLQEYPVIAQQPATYELSVGNAERHRLALLLAYGHEEGERPDPNVLPISRLSLTITALAQ